MAVKIRFTRIGKKHAPVYRIVAVDSRQKRDGKYLENLGTYNPLSREIVQWHQDRLDYWTSVGAEMTDAVKRLQKIMNKKAKAAAEVKPAEEKKAPAKKAAPKKAAPKKAAEKKEVAEKAVEAAPKAEADSKE